MGRRTKKTRILIADDHPIFRAGLIQAISDRGTLVVAGEAADGLEMLEEAARLRPDIIVLDIDLPELDGIEATKRLRKGDSTAEVIFLTMHKDRSYLRAMEPLRVKGYVLKDSAMNEIVECIDTVKKGHSYLSHSLNDLIVSEVGTQSADRLSSIESLSPTERKVLARISDSKTTREIADEMFVSVRTVETHRYNICSKVGIKGSHALLKFAIRNRRRIHTTLAGD